MAQQGEERARESHALQSAAMQRRHLRVALVFFPLALIAFTQSTSVVILATPVLGLALAEVLGVLLMRPRTARSIRALAPLCAALIGGGTVIAAASRLADFGALHYVSMTVIAGGLALLVSATRRSFIVSIASLGAMAVIGAYFVALSHPTFDGIQAASLSVVGLLVPYLLSDVFAQARQDAAALQHELARRATSDEITGVSNKAHINVLAQNEFSRARRYGEPFSCLMIEIERYDDLLATHGSAAVTAIVQVLTGYCVVVMRHCDSFGRLTQSRFLALLPETPAAGANTLANRMCRDVAGLSVAVGGEKLNFTVSVGWTEMHAVDRSAADMLRRADQGLADAHEQGGNCAVCAAVPVHQPVDATADPSSATAGSSP